MPELIRAEEAKAIILKGEAKGSLNVKGDLRFGPQDGLEDHMLPPGLRVDGELGLDGCDITHGLPSCEVSALSISIRACAGIKEVSSWRAATHALIADCPALTAIRGVTVAEGALRVERCHSLRTLSFGALERLHVEGCASLESEGLQGGWADAASLVDLPRLKSAAILHRTGHLELVSCHALASLGSEGITRGETVRVTDCARFERLAQPKESPCLLTGDLLVADCPRFQGIDPGATVNGDVRITRCADFAQKHFQFTVGGDLVLRECPERGRAVEEFRVGGSAYRSDGPQETAVIDSYSPLRSWVGATHDPERNEWREDASAGIDPHCEVALDGCLVTGPGEMPPHLAATLEHAAQVAVSGTAFRLPPLFACRPEDAWRLRHIPALVAVEPLCMDAESGEWRPLAGDPGVRKAPCAVRLTTKGGNASLRRRTVRVPALLGNDRGLGLEAAPIAVDPDHPAAPAASRALEALSDALSKAYFRPQALSAADKESGRRAKEVDAFRERAVGFAKGALDKAGESPAPKPKAKRPSPSP